MAVTDDTAAEYALLTSASGVIDRSELGKLWLHGNEAKEFLHGQVTNDVEGLTAGTGCYAAFLTHKGKMLGDMRILDCGDGLWIDCERSVLQELFTLIRRFKIGRHVELDKRTLERGLLSVVGDVEAVEGSFATRDEHEHLLLDVGGVPARAVRTDLGVDLICAADRTADLIAVLGVPLVSETTAEILRVESGRPRYGIDLDDAVIPQEAGLNGRAVSFTKGCYVGQETVARLYYKGKPNRHLRGLRLSAPVDTGTELRLGERVVGKVGSSVVSPRLGPIALAIVRREAGPGDVLDAGDGATGTVVDLPFG